MASLCTRAVIERASLGIRAVIERANMGVKGVVVVEPSVPQIIFAHPAEVHWCHPHPHLHHHYPTVPSPSPGTCGVRVFGGTCVVRITGCIDASPSSNPSPSPSTCTCVVTVTDASPCAYADQVMISLWGKAKTHSWHEGREGEGEGRCGGRMG